MVGRRGAVDVQSASLWPGQTLADWERDPASAFEAWLAGEVVAHTRRFRDVSQATYRDHFGAWLKHLARKQCGFLEASSAEAASFFSERPKDKVLEPVSRRRYLQLLARVYQSLEPLGWGRPNPMGAELRQERALDPEPPESLDDTDVEKLFAAVATLPGWKGARDRALLALLVSAGLRANEAIALPLTAVSAEHRVDIAPEGVHRAHRSLILPGVGRQHWQDWCSAREPLGVPGPLAFPATRAGRPYSESGLYRRIDTWLAAAGIAKTRDRGANLLRNTFARRALARYVPEEVQEFLGHDELRATLRHLPPERAPA